MSLLPVGAGSLRAITYLTMPLKFLPSSFWLFYEISNLFSDNSWTSPFQLFINIVSVIVALWSSIGVWIQAFSFLPIDLWINIETFFWPDSIKSTDEFSITFIRIASWIVIGYTSINSVNYMVDAIITDINTGVWNEVMAQTVVKVISSIFALAPAISYLFQVNQYASYM